MSQTLPSVVVTWNDAWSDMSEFVSVGDAHLLHKPNVIQTRGLLLLENEEGVSIVSDSTTENGQTLYRGRTFIPRGMVISVEPWPTPKKTRKKPVKPTNSTIPKEGTPNVQVS